MYTPTIKNFTSEITDVKLADDSSGSRNYRKFDCDFVDGKAIITARPGEPYIEGGSYKLQLEFELNNDDRTTIKTKDIIIKPVQSAVRHNIPKNLTMYQSRAGFVEVIDLSAISPVGAKINSLVFKPESPGRLVNNPNGAYLFNFDERAQKLHVWIKDSKSVKPGKNTLTFSVTYDGQSLEKIDKAGTMGAKPIDLKLPVNILK